MMVAALPAIDAFWEKEDSADHIDWSKAQRAVFPNLKPSTTSISIQAFQRSLDAN
jgi:CopG antitoxin of type II toxin-antitoxin system